MYVREDRETALQTDRLFELINTYIIQQKYMLPMLAFFSKSYDWECYMFPSEQEPF